MRRFVAGAIAVLITIAASGCFAPAATPEASTSPTDATPAIQSATPSPPAPAPTSSLNGAPAGLPVMPGAEAADPTTLEAGVIARWTVRAIGPEVYQYYLDALPDAGFTIAGRFPGGNVAIIRFTTPAGMTLDLSLVGEGDHAGRTRIDLIRPERP